MQVCCEKCLLCEAPLRPGRWPSLTASEWREAMGGKVRGAGVFGWHDGYERTCMQVGFYAFFAPEIGDVS